MTTTQQLIDSLADQGKPVRGLMPFGRVLMLGLLGLLAYGFVGGCFLATRADLHLQWQRPLFVAEISGLLLLIITHFSALAQLRAPDGYQQAWPTYAAKASLALYAGVVMWQFVAPIHPDMAMPVGGHLQGMTCTICILSVAVLPMLCMVIFGRRGATTQPRALMFHTVVVATAVGCVLLRLEEPQDNPNHLLLWHTAPSLLLAMVGAWIGKKILKW